MNYSTTAIAVGQKVLGYTVALIGSLVLAGTAQAAVHGITGTDFQPDRTARLYQPARRRAHLLLGLRMHGGLDTARSFPPRMHRLAAAPKCRCLVRR